MMSRCDVLISPRLCTCVHPNWRPPPHPLHGGRIRARCNDFVGFRNGLMAVTSHPLAVREVDSAKRKTASSLTLWVSLWVLSQSQTPGVTQSTSLQELVVKIQSSF